MKSLRSFRHADDPAKPFEAFAEDVRSAVTPGECVELARQASGRRVLELGSYLGRSTIALASTAEVVHSVDPHTDVSAGVESTLPGFLENLERYGVRDRVVVHVGTSTEIVPLFRAASFDFAFVDAVHHRPHVDRDIVLCAACLAPAGVLALHDYATDGAWADGVWHPFSVREAVDEFADRAGIDVRVVDSMGILEASEDMDRWRAALDAAAMH
jgi:predicted O-methyltransferase YrrM